MANSIADTGKGAGASGVQDAHIGALPELPWATYRPASIVGICHLPDNRHWVSVNAAGEVTVWRGDERRGAFRLSPPASPRSTAAHPTEPCVAVATKGPEPAISLFDNGTLAIN